MQENLPQIKHKCSNICFQRQPKTSIQSQNQLMFVANRFLETLKDIIYTRFYLKEILVIVIT